MLHRWRVVALLLRRMRMVLDGRCLRRRMRRLVLVGMMMLLLNVVLRRWLLEVILDVGQAGAHGFAMGEHETLLSHFCLAQSHSDFQAAGGSSSLKPSEWWMFRLFQVVSHG